VYFLAQKLVITNIDIIDGGNDNFLQDLDDNLIYRRVKPPVSTLNILLLKYSGFKGLNSYGFSPNLVGKEGPRIPGVKDSWVCFIKTLSAPLTFFRFLRCLYLVYPIHPFQFAILEGIDTTDLLIFEVRSYLSSFENLAVILYISKLSSYDFCQTFNSF